MIGAKDWKVEANSPFTCSLIGGRVSSVRTPFRMGTVVQVQEGRQERGDGNCCEEGERKFEFWKLENSEYGCRYEYKLPAIVCSSNSVWILWFAGYFEERIHYCILAIAS